MNDARTGAEWLAECNRKLDQIEELAVATGSYTAALHYVLGDWGLHPIKHAEQYAKMDDMYREDERYIPNTIEVRRVWGDCPDAQEYRNYGGTD